MTNHVHLMRDLGQRYVQYFNRRHDRTGTLWEGRFRSCVVESARYVLGCYRYIESNPVRARVFRARLIRDATNGDYPLGSKGFKALLFASLGRRTERQKAGRRAKSRDGIYAVG